MEACSVGERTDGEVRQIKGPSMLVSRVGEEKG